MYMYHVCLECACYQVQGRGDEEEEGRNSEVREDRSLLQPEEGRSGNAISQGDGPKVMVTTRSREKSAIFCCVQLSILLMSGWLYTEWQEW